MTNQILIKPFAQRIVRFMLIILAALLGLAVLLTGWLLLLSPGRVEAYRDQNGTVLAGSISEKTFVNIGGAEQGMFIKGKNTDNPVLLFLHGGPGMPTYFLSKQYPAGLEDNFVVCYWEQRDAGISYNPAITAESMTAEKLVSDAIEVTNYLRERFGREKIYLMGHSWGSFLGIQAAAKEPELYYAYIGVSQVTKQLESEKLAYKWMLEQYTQAGNTAKANKLKAYPILENDTSAAAWFKDPARDTTMHELGIGTMHNMKDVYNGVFFPFLGTREYTVTEKMNTFFRSRPFLKNQTKLIDQLFATDITAKVPELEIPVYFLSGSYDLTVNHALNKAYLERLQAPIKGYYTFSESAHCPMHEEPARFMEIMVEDVLNGTAALADK